MNDKIIQDEKKDKLKIEDKVDNEKPDSDNQFEDNKLNDLIHENIIPTNISENIENKITETKQLINHDSEELLSDSFSFANSTQRAEKCTDIFYRELKNW